MEVLRRVLSLSATEARLLIKDYKGTPTRRQPVRLREVRLKAFRLPYKTEPMKRMHMDYLKGRGFDPYFLEKEWGLLGTGPLSTMDKLKYKFRILVPIFWGGSQVSWLTRDATNKQKLKYMVCPKDRERVDHKTIIYMHPDFDGSKCIVVEGVTDVWKLGREAVGTFGIKYTPAQVRVLADMFEEVSILFDTSDPEAPKQARKLKADLSFRGTIVDILKLPDASDPGSLTQEQANKFMEEWRGNR